MQSNVFRIKSSVEFFRFCTGEEYIPEEKKSKSEVSSKKKPPKNSTKVESNLPLPSMKERENGE